MTTAETNQTETNPAHGGRLIDLLATGSEADELRAKAEGLPSVTLEERALSDLELLTVGGYSPLEGFMTQADYRAVVSDMHLASGVAWSMPIKLAVSEDASVGEGDEVALADESGRRLAILKIEEKFGYDKREEARNVYRTEDEEHPGVAAVYADGDVLIGGPVRAFVPGATN